MWDVSHSYHRQLYSGRAGLGFNWHNSIHITNCMHTVHMVIADFSQLIMNRIPIIYTESCYKIQNLCMHPLPSLGTWLVVVIQNYI